jgi:hypothetical protein
MERTSRPGGLWRRGTVCRLPTRGGQPLRLPFIDGLPARSWAIDGGPGREGRQSHCLSRCYSGLQLEMSYGHQPEALG